MHTVWWLYKNTRIYTKECLLQISTCMNMIKKIKDKDIIIHPLLDGTNSGQPVPLPSRPWVIPYPFSNPSQVNPSLSFCKFNNLFYFPMSGLKPTTFVSWTILDTTTPAVQSPVNQSMIFKYWRLYWSWSDGAIATLHTVVMQQRHHFYQNHRRMALFI